MIKNLKLFISDILDSFGYKSYLLIFLMVISGLMEGLALSLLLPLLHLVGIGNLAGKNNYLEVTKKIFADFSMDFNVYTVAFVCCSIFIFQYLIFLMQSLMAARMQSTYISTIRNKLFTAVLAAKWSYFVNNKTSTISNAIINEPIRVSQAFELLFNLCSTTIVTIVYISIAILISWKITLSLLAVGIIMSLVLFVLMKRANRIGADISKRNESFFGLVNEALSGMKIIKASSAENFVNSHFISIESNIRKLYMWLVLQPNLLRSVIESSAIIGIVAALIICTQVFVINIATLLVVLALFVRIHPKLSVFQHNLQTIAMQIPALLYINNVYQDAKNSQEFNEDLNNANVQQKDLNLCGQPVAISINNLSVIHDERLIINNLSMEIPARKLIAITGPSGIGKTTILDCLIGLVKPSSGDILINNTSLQNYSLSSWRCNIGYVTQDTFLFNASIRENIIWDSKNITEEAFAEACRVAGVDELVLKLQHGYNTIVGDRALKLSGGERQRVGIARAILGKKSLLILDEATSALDLDTESKLMKNIITLRSRLTIIMVAHKLTTLKHADCIYYLDGKSLIKYEHDSLQEFVNNNNLANKNHKNTNLALEQ